MKTFWKALGIAALAAVVPVRFKKDKETGAKTFQSLLWKLNVSPKDGDNVEIGLDLMEGVITGPLMNVIDAKKEAELFTDDPEEAVLFADELQLVADGAAAVADGAREIADEVQTAADEAQDAASGTAEAAETDFDPEF